MTAPLRVLVAATEFPGHAFPEFALAGALRRRGHEVLLLTAERWRDDVAHLDTEFLAIEEVAGVAHHGAFDERLVRAVRALQPAVADLGPDVVVSDQVTAAPPLAAELAGARRATVMATVMPFDSPGLPPYPLGLLPPRTRAGAAAWRLAGRTTSRLRSRSRRLRELARELDRVRGALGLGPDRRPLGAFTPYGPISDELALVATFPQLEYPRAWPPHVHVCGPMLFEPPREPAPLPHGDGPLVVVASSTSQDPGLELVRVALAALADEPVRVIASAGGHDPGLLPETPENANVIDWASYGELLPAAALTVARGGHGTMVESLAAGTPLLICPAAGDQPENGARVTWAGAGRVLPAPLLGRRALRAAVRAALADADLERRAADLAAWSRRNDGAVRGAELIERLAAA